MSSFAAQRETVQAHCARGCMPFPLEKYGHGGVTIRRVGIEGTRRHGVRKISTQKMKATLENQVPQEWGRGAAILI